MFNVRFIVLYVILFGCSQTTPDLYSHENNSGIDFANNLENSDEMDVFRYRNYYNGGGVAIGDINNDGLSDVFLTSNQKENKLYLNRGGFKFNDITQRAGLSGTKPWSTGVSMADINSDGWLDVYVCNSGDITGSNRGNELFINNQDGTFLEKAEQYGLDDKGFSTHAAFFDFDHDGDLDCYLLNNSFRPVSSLPIENTRNRRDEFGGDKFYINDQGIFKDVSEQVGVYGSVIGFGLGITLLDINNDGWADIYISNDFFERDYLYVNINGERFEERLEDYFDQISLFSMGADAADLNNDGLNELFVTDMLPDNHERLKQTTKFDSYDFHNLKVSKGFYNQFMKNTLQMNNGDNTYTEVARQLGISASDWSWGALLFDMDNDGYKDIFVTNGIYKDVTDQDFLSYFSNEENLKAAKSGRQNSFVEFNKRMPSTPLSNKAFTLAEPMQYVDQASAWGLAEPSFSNGAAYGDLDNDGDLDLIVNNVNQKAFVYKNNSDQISDNHFLRIKLEGSPLNPFAVGAKIDIYLGREVISYHHFPTKGFQSSMDYVPIFGLGTATAIDSLNVSWTPNAETKMIGVPVDTTLVLSFNNRTDRTEKILENQNVIFRPISIEQSHRENRFVDFDETRLLYHQLSSEGPCIAVADINNDGLDDFYLGGSVNMSGKLLINNGNDSFYVYETDLFDQFQISEDVDARFFDADNDGDKDLLVLAGGSDLRGDLRHYRPRLYINNSKGKRIIFTIQKNFPVLSMAGSCIREADFDMDGDIDVFLGGRFKPGQYGLPTNSYLLENSGEAKFTDVTNKYINQLADLGMVTDAVWLDYDQDKDADLFIVGDWMPIILFENKGSFFQRKFNIPGLQENKGWWLSILPFDINEDGLMDLILGNWGTNSMFKASYKEPIRLYINDFDQNGTLDHIFTFKKGENYFPYHLRDELTRQLVMLKKKFPDYASYADKSIDQIIDPKALANSYQLTAFQLSSGVLINNGNDSFEFSTLPREAQVSPIMEMLNDDFDQDGSNEVLIMGNFYGTRPEEAIYDANHGFLLKKVNGQLEVELTGKMGLYVKGEVRALRTLKGKTKKLLLIGRNNDKLQLYAY